MLEDFRLQVFMAVAREKSFTKAAAELGVSQPAVSQNIAELEKTMGCRLFERLRGEVVLTGKGEAFREYADRLLRICAEIGDMFAPLAAANVRICASEELYNYMVYPALESFRRLHPQVTFERTMFENADLVLSIRPSGDMPSDSVARIRMSSASSFDVIFQPSDKFACTRLCRLIKAFLNPLNY